MVWIAVLAYILWHLLRSCFRRQTSTTARRPDTGSSRPPYNTGWFSAFRPEDRHDPPPPYSKYASSAAPARPSIAEWRPGFWTGAALGGLGAYLFGNSGRHEPPTTTAYDWERARMPRVSPMASSGYPVYTTSRRSFFGSDDHGEGPSNLGPMRRSTGLGGSSVR